jgi:hypothetical protein
MMYGPVMTCGLAANNEDSIRAGHRQDAISLYIRYTYHSSSFDVVSLFSRQAWKVDMKNSPHTRSSFLPVVYAYSIMKIFTARLLESKQVSQTKLSLLFSIFCFSISGQYKWQLELG